MVCSAWFFFPPIKVAKIYFAQKNGKEKKIPPVHNIISEKEVQQQRSNIFMVKVHFLTHFSIHVNKYLYSQYLDRVSLSIRKYAPECGKLCSVSTYVELIDIYFNIKIK